MGKLSVNRSKHARGIKRSDYANENSILSLLIYEIFLRRTRGNGWEKGEGEEGREDAQEMQKT